MATAHILERKWRSDDVRIKEKADFSVMLLSDPIISGLKKAGFVTPSPVQLDAIPLGCLGKDLLVRAKSGTGKTLVFTIIALEKLKQDLPYPQVLIVAPTREIAAQICSVVRSVASSFHNLTCNCFIGGLPISADLEIVENCQIVVGTPGRISRLIRQGSLPIDDIRLLVFDEADKLVNRTLKCEIDHIFAALPAEKQVIATSATYTAELAVTVFRYLKNPYVACPSSNEVALIGVINYISIAESSLMPLLQYRYKLEVLEKVLTSMSFSQCLVFCNMIGSVSILSADIRKWGFSTSSISSALTQAQRLEAIEKLRHFKCKVLVSSDVTSRGIDVENVNLIINFDLAPRTEVHLHRVGRAGRYGSNGIAVTIITDDQLPHLKQIEVDAGFYTYKLPDPIPKDLIRNPVCGDLTFVHDISHPDVDSINESPANCDIDEDESSMHKGSTSNKRSEESCQLNVNPSVPLADSVELIQSSVNKNLKREKCLKPTLHGKEGRVETWLNDQRENFQENPRHDFVSVSSSEYSDTDSDSSSFECSSYKEIIFLKNEETEDMPIKFSSPESSTSDSNLSSATSHNSSGKFQKNIKKFVNTCNIKPKNKPCFKYSQTQSSIKETSTCNYLKTDRFPKNHWLVNTKYETSSQGENYPSCSNASSIKSNQLKRRETSCKKRATSCLKNNCFVGEHNHCARNDHSQFACKRGEMANLKHCCQASNYWYPGGQLACCLCHPRSNTTCHQSAQIACCPPIPIMNPYDIFYEQWRYIQFCVNRNYNLSLM